MTTRNIVPRADGEGSLGTSTKKWGTVNAKTISADNISGVYQNISALQANTSLKSGMCVLVTGKSTAGDGGGGTYLIRSRKSGESANGSSIIFVGSLTAELLSGGSSAGGIPNGVTFYRPEWHTVTNTVITVKSGLIVEISGVYYKLQNNKALNIADVGIASNRAGKDFYIYAVVKSGSLDLVLSANSTVPSGYNAENSRKIGGFHCLCKAVGNLTWTHPISGESVQHKLSGFVDGDIIPNSLWDLSHRPKGEPEGYAYIEEVNVWMSIYLLSFDGSKLRSVFGGTCADGASTPKWHGEKFAECMAYQNGRLPWRREFVIAAKGSNEQTAIVGVNDKGVTGGWSDTAGRRMISDYGLEDCCGFMWQWFEDLGFAGGSGWSNSTYASGVDPRSYGSAYGTLFRLLGGGRWSDSSSCGSRSARCSGASGSVSAADGGRGVLEPMA